MNKQYYKGVSLIEAMIVVAILGIITSVAAPSFIKILNRQRVKVIAENIASDMAFMRSESTLRADTIIMYIKQTPTMSCYVIAYGKGQFGSCDCTMGPGLACNPATTSIRELKTYQVPANTGIKITPAGGWPAWASNRWAFVAPQMLPTYSDVSLTVDGPTGEQLRVRLSPSGRPQKCSPNGSYSGVPIC